MILYPHDQTSELSPNAELEKNNKTPSILAGAAANKYEIILSVGNIDVTPLSFAKPCSSLSKAMPPIRGKLTIFY